MMNLNIDLSAALALTFCFIMQISMSIVFAEDQLQLADKHKASGNYKEAERLYARAMINYAIDGKAEDREFCRILKDLAETNLLLREHTEAEAMAVRACDKSRAILGDEDQVYAQSLSVLARVYSAQRKHFQARQEMLKATHVMVLAVGEARQVYRTTLNHLADVYSRARMYKEAEQQLLKVVHLQAAVSDGDAAYARCQLRLAQVYMHMGRYDAALQCFELFNGIRNKAEKTHHIFAEGLRYQAKLHEQMGSFDLAVTVGKQALDTFTLLYGGQNWHVKKSIKDLAFYQKQQSLMNNNPFEGKEPTTAVEYYKRANYLGRIRKYKEAIADIEEAIKLDPASAKDTGYYLITDLTQKNKDWVLEKKACEQWAAKCPDYSKAVNHLAWHLLTNGDPALRDPAEGLKYALIANEQSGGNVANILDTLAYAYFLTGDVEKAIATQKKVLSLTGRRSGNWTEFHQRLLEFQAAQQSE